MAKKPTPPITEKAEPVEDVTLSNALQAGAADPATGASDDDASKATDAEGNSPEQVSTELPKAAKQPELETIKAKGDRRVASVAGTIHHDGETYELGDPITLTQKQFTALIPTGAVVETDWDELPDATENS